MQPPYPHPDNNGNTSNRQGAAVEAENGILSKRYNNFCQGYVTDVIFIAPYDKMNSRGLTITLWILLLKKINQE